MESLESFFLPFLPPRINIDLLILKEKGQPDPGHCLKKN